MAAPPLQANPTPRIFGVSPRMAELAFATVRTHAATPLRSLFVTAYIQPNAGSHTHTKGAFGPAVSRPASFVYDVVDGLVKRSPGLCGANATLVVMHNLQLSGVALEPWSRHVRHRVVYIRVPDDPTIRMMPPLNTRFVVLEQLLQRVRWDCAYALDLSDVDVLRAPPCEALKPDELMMGTDSCGGGMSKWLGGRLVRSGMLRDDSGRYGSAISDGKERSASTFGGRSAIDIVRRGEGKCILSAALVGGRRSALMPALRNVSMMLRANYERRLASREQLAEGGVAPFYWAEDMVAWNLVGQERQSERLLIGYPFGPTNLPMYGGLSREHLDPAVQTKSQHCSRTEACRQGWLRRVGHHYWFGHKMSSSWRYHIVDGGCQRQKVIMTSGPRKGAPEGREWKLPRDNCTMPTALKGPSQASCVDTTFAL